HRCGILGQRFAGVGRRLLLVGRRGRLIGWGLLVLCGSLLPGRSAGLACGCLLLPGRRFLCRCRRFGRGLLLFGGSLLPGRRLFSGGLVLVGRCRGFCLGRRLLLLGRGGRPIGRSLLFVSRSLGGSLLLLRWCFLRGGGGFFFRRSLRLYGRRLFFGRRLLLGGCLLFGRRLLGLQSFDLGLDRRPLLIRQVRVLQPLPKLLERHLRKEDRRLRGGRNGPGRAAPCTKRCGAERRRCRRR